jgi:PEP-CTERM motif
MRHKAVSGPCDKSATICPFAHQTDAKDAPAKITQVIPSEQLTDSMLAARSATALKQGSGTRHAPRVTVEQGLASPSNVFNLMESTLMVRKLVGACSLLALLASGAAAQSFSQVFTFVGNPANPDVYTGSFAAGPNEFMTGQPPATNFQIWCVDPLQFVNPNQVYNPAQITPFSSSNFSNTLAEFSQPGHAAVGAAALDDYKKAAYLGLEMNSAAPANFESYQFAIWLVMGYTPIAGYNGWTIETGGNVATANGYITAMGTSWQSIPTSDWGVITGGNTVQEFIYQAQPGGHLTSLVPEPATMSLVAMGIVGMAGASFRRRKRTK